MTEFAPQDLPRWAQVIADWAELLPVRNVYVFDKPRLRDRTECVGLAIEFDGEAGEAALKRWAHESDTDFAQLKAALGMPIAIYGEPEDQAWPLILNAAKVPKLTLGKVHVIPTP